MCMPRPRNVQLPLQPRTLLIADVTKLQPFTVGGDKFRENIETLISYNVRTDGIKQDCLYIQQGHLLTPTIFYDLFNGGGSPPISSCNMDTYKEVFYAAGVPALISTGITLLYLLLKAYQFAVYALPHQAERRLAAATPGGRQQVHGSVAREKGYQEIHEQVPGNLSNEYGAELQKPSGTIPLSRGRENICIATRRNAEEHSVEPFVRENAKRLQGRGDRHTKDNDGQRSRSPHDDSAGVPAQGGRWPNAENEQSRNDGRASNQERSDTTTYDGISGRRDPEKQVSDVSIQTDTCDTLYVTKNTLTAYTIAVVQNSQALQYDQMHAALQSARNQSSLETPLKAEDLLSAHFNLAVLESHIIPDAEECSNNTQNADPSTSAPDEQTYVKIPSRYAENSTTRRTNPTGAVTPTRRRDFGLVNAIPAGYESDDSWDNMSHNHEHTHTHNIVPLLTLRPWRNSPRRPPEPQQFRQQSATNVRSGNAPYPRPWDSQPYGRRTRSQQALRARAYRKVQRRYPIQ